MYVILIIITIIGAIIIGINGFNVDIIYGKNKGTEHRAHQREL